MANVSNEWILFFLDYNSINFNIFVCTFRWFLWECLFTRRTITQFMEVYMHVLVSGSNLPKICDKIGIWNIIFTIFQFALIIHILRVRAFSHTRFDFPPSFIVLFYYDSINHLFLHHHNIFFLHFMFLLLLLLFNNRTMNLNEERYAYSYGPISESFEWWSIYKRREKEKSEEMSPTCINWL